MEALRVRELNAYYGKAHVLHGIDFVATAGAVTGVLGRNGAGKTTLLKSIMRLGPRVDGRVEILGRKTASLSSDTIARLGVAYMPQNVRVFPNLSVRDNIRAAAAAMTNPRPLQQVVEVLPELEPLLDRAAGTLSGGQQQIVGIGRSVAMQCRLLMMDEPTEGLMPVLVHRVGSIIRQLAGNGVAIVLVEQNVHLARRVCDRFYVLEKGYVKAEGGCAELRDESNLERYLGVDVLTSTPVQAV